MKCKEFLTESVLPTHIILKSIVVAYDCFLLAPIDARLNYENLKLKQLVISEMSNKNPSLEQKFSTSSTRFFIRNLDQAIVLKFLNLTRNFVHFSTKSFLIGFLFFECMNCQCGR